MRWSALRTLDRTEPVAMQPRELARRGGGGGVRRPGSNGRGDTELCTWRFKFKRLENFRNTLGDTLRRLKGMEG